MKIKIEWTLLCLVLLGACGQDPILQHSFPRGCWALSDTLFFETTHRGLALDFTFSAQDYPYQNLYLQVGSKSSGNPIQIGDTLIDPLGNWRVELYGNTAEKSIYVQLPEKAGSQYWLIHYLRDSSLCGIQTLEIRSQSGDN